MRIVKITTEHNHRGTEVFWATSKTNSEEILKEQYAIPEDDEISDCPVGGPPQSHTTRLFEVPRSKKAFVAFLRAFTPSTDNG